MKVAPAPDLSAVASAKAEAHFSRFIHAVVDPYLVRHPKMSRFLAQVPLMSRFYILPAVATTPRVAPVYNARARKSQPPHFKL